MIWILAITTPLIVAMLIRVPGLGKVTRFLLGPLAPLPALYLALAGPAAGAAVHDPLILGMHLGFGPAGQVFLLFTSGLWMAAAVYSAGYMPASGHRKRFDGFFLLTMMGNFGLILARDVPSFYAFFAIMTFAGFGLVIHTGSTSAHRAARLYLIAAVLGEALLLAALLMAVAAADSVMLADLPAAVAASESRNSIMLLAFFGFGVKAGALPMHFWLPLAHPVAPVPASAVLSGAMIKAGLLGWLHVFPLGHGSFAAWGFFCIIAGLMAAFGAVGVGTLQKESKTILAYSSISQMGVMTVAIGIGLLRAEAWVALFPVLLIYALNHAFAKGALFLGTGIARTRVPSGLLMAGLIVPALAIAGGPWSGGAIAKEALKSAAADVTETMAPWLNWALPLTAVGTSILLGRFLQVVWRESKAPQPAKPLPFMLGSWLVLLAGVVLAVSFTIDHYAYTIARTGPGTAGLWNNSWPLALGAGLLLLGIRLLHPCRKDCVIPAGDIVVILERIPAWLARWSSSIQLPRPALILNLSRPLQRIPESSRHADFANRLEERLRHRALPGLIFLVILLILIALFVFGNPVG
jgi:formate hydrogenlyase subunit 3/multisubunit Na+/H+ antiporter MnhD subunit